MHKDEFNSGSVLTEVTDVAFKNVNKHATGFHIWRVEKSGLLPVAKDQYGTFYDTDSYVVYCACPYGKYGGSDTVVRDMRGVALEHHTHFWLGKFSSSEKSGLAAYKTVELDVHLGGITTQHREAQEYESARFQCYFKNGFRILKKENEMYASSSEPRLYRVKGRRVPILIQLPSVDWKYFSSRNVYLIATETIMFIWMGRTSHQIEKVHSTQVALQVMEQYNIPSMTFVDDGYEKTLPHNVIQILNQNLSLNERTIFPLEELESAEEKRRTDQEHNLIRLYKCSENKGKYRVVEIKLNPLLQTDLDSKDAFILDNGVQGVWIWVGKDTSSKEQTEALRNARGFVKKKRYPNQTKVTKVIDGAEPHEFKVLFRYWKNMDDNVAGKKPTKIALSKFDADFMNDRPTLSAQMQLIDDGSGVVKVWRICNGECADVPKERHHVFFCGDSYVVLYTYEVDCERRHVIYSWLGKHCSREFHHTISRATELNAEVGGVALQVRVFQEHEPAHFLQLFKGKMIVFQGTEFEFYATGRPAQYLLETRGLTTYSTIALEVACKTTSLNSNLCFVLKRGKRSIIWCGKNTTGDQREMAKNFAGRDFEILLEGKEQNDFWAFLGGKCPYPTTKYSHCDDVYKAPRLFHYSRVNEKIKTEEILKFSQSDLKPEETMLLDVMETVFIWVGNLSNCRSAHICLTIGEDYLKNDPAGRNLHTPIVIVNQGHEPHIFGGFFDNWDRKLWMDYNSFNEIRHKLEGQNRQLYKKEVHAIRHEGTENFDQYDKYPIRILKEPNDKLPPKINPINKELHLTHDDFVVLFKMSYKEFVQLPRWKQQELKKKAGMF